MQPLDSTLRASLSFSLVWISAQPASAQWTITDQAAPYDRYGSAVTVGDFDGDGYPDLAVGIPYEDVNGDADAGAVRVSYGGPGGPGSGGSDYWTEDSSGVPSSALPGERFGEALCVGDFDCDGWDDLAVGVPRENAAGDAEAGAVFVLFGGPSGLSAAGSQYLHQDVPGIQGGAEPGDRFGACLASADFDGDGCDDLAIGVPYEDIGSTKPDAGAVNVLRGSEGLGLVAANDQIWYLDVYGTVGASHTADSYGCALAVGDFDADGSPDLAIGARYYDLVGWDGSTAQNGGAVHVLYSEPFQGPTTSNQDIWFPQLLSEPVWFSVGAAFGTALAAGDFDHDGICDLAIGAPNAYSFQAWAQGGVVHVLPGRDVYGLQWPFHAVWHQDVPGVAGGVEPGDRFGASLAVGQFDFTGLDALVVGVPGEDIGSIPDAGAIHVLYTAGAIEGTLGGGTQIWYQNVGGIEGSSGASDEYGAALATGDVTGDGIGDVVVGIPGETIGGHPRAGAVNVLRGEAESSVVASGDLLLHEWVWSLPPIAW